MEKGELTPLTQILKTIPVKYGWQNADGKGLCRKAPPNILWLLPLPHQHLHRAPSRVMLRLLVLTVSVETAPELACSHAHMSIPP